MFSEINYDTSCNANEYVFGHVRRMTGRPPSMVYYLDNARHRSTVVLGQSFRPTVFSFHSMQITYTLMEETWVRLNNHEDGASDRLQAVTLLMEVASLSLSGRASFENWFASCSAASLDDWFDCLTSISPSR